MIPRFNAPPPIPARSSLRPRNTTSRPAISSEVEAFHGFNSLSRIVCIIFVFSFGLICLCFCDLLFRFCCRMLFSSALLSHLHLANLDLCTGTPIRHLILITPSSHGHYIYTIQSLGSFTPSTFCVHNLRLLTLIHLVVLTRCSIDNSALFC